MTKIPKKALWTIDINTYMDIVHLAKKHGKKTGDNMQSEFEEVLKTKKDKIKLLGITETDIDLLTGNLREHGVKVLNLKEIERKRRNHD